jgi:site-specific DNA recombinase
MPSINGHGPKRAILYARVSTDEQARSGYSLAQQMEALRDYAAREGYEVLEEVLEPGQSGASLERPGMDRVRDLVAADSVSVVLAQDRDRFAREPAYLYLLREEFRERDCSLRALNDNGDDSPEGELTAGLLDQIARYERAKIAQRTQRGKIRRAKEGKIVGVTSAMYGFEYNKARDNYVVNEEKMAKVRRIFRMVGVEGYPINAVKVAFDREGIPTPGAAAYWSKKTIRDVILDDSYKPHDAEEIASLVAEGLLSAEVAARLNPEERYGVWWFNRMRVRRKQTSERGPEGLVYRRRSKSTEKPREQWVAVPIPDAGIPCDWVNAAREAIKDNRPISSAGRRLWPLSGGVFLCGGCGRRMFPNGSGGHNGRSYVYYRCPKRIAHGPEACIHRKQYRAEKVEAAAWVLVSGLLKNPSRLQVALTKMIDQERRAMRGDPDREAQTWLTKLNETDRKRSRFQEMAAEAS